MQGRVALDTVTLAQPPLRLTSQAIGMAIQSTADFASASCDGIFVRTHLKLCIYHSQLSYDYALPLIVYIASKKIILAKGTRHT